MLGVETQGEYMIKNVMASIVATVMFGAEAMAEFIVVNNPVVDTVGFYSDAFDSKGAYTYAQSGAQAFDLEDSYTTSSLRWWGSMNCFNGQGISNIDCFQIIVWNNGFGSVPPVFPCPASPPCPVDEEVPGLLFSSVVPLVSLLLVPAPSCVPPLWVCEP